MSATDQQTDAAAAVGTTPLSDAEQLFDVTLRSPVLVALLFTCLGLGLAAARSVRQSQT